VSLVALEAIIMSRDDTIYHTLQDLCAEEKNEHTFSPPCDLIYPDLLFTPILTPLIPVYFQNTKLCGESTQTGDDIFILGLN